MDNDQLNTLYHYCSLNTFLNIMKNKSIWISDVTRSNDFLELIALRRLLSKEINADLNEIIERNNMSGGNPELAKGLWTLRDEFNIKLNTAYAQTFAFCLSEKGDLLSQWRGYADDGAGVSIGFKVDFFNSLKTKMLELKIPLVMDFNKVIYDEFVAKDYISNQLGQFNLNGCNMVGEYEIALNKIGSKIAVDAPFYKNGAFSEEYEWRFIISHFVDNLGKIDLSLLNDDECSLGNIDYIVCKNRLIPHIEIKIKNMKNAISEIVIGPKCQEREVDIKHFLICMGILDDLADKSIQISKSKASYR